MFLIFSYVMTTQSMSWKAEIHYRYFSFIKYTVFWGGGSFDNCFGLHSHFPVTIAMTFCTPGLLYRTKRDSFYLYRHKIMFLSWYI